MKLLLSQPFSIEIPTEGKKDEVITGTLRDFTKAEKAKFKKTFKKNTDKSKDIKRKLRELKRLEDENKKGTLEDIEKIYQLEDEIEKETELVNNQDIVEAAAKDRFNTCVESPKKDRLTELSDSVGYVALLEVMIKDIAEKKKKGTPAL